ncbi:integrase [archaeon]|nr:integrase [archaeon]|tara:strand:- start:906 stop:2114 length:1209 start_codon:yes stop_codon:yes gene_type:complete
MKNPDIHRYERRLETHRNVVRNSKILECNKELIFKFEEYGSLIGLSKPRLAKYLEILKLSAEIINKDFSKVKKEDIMNFVKVINERDYSPWTKQAYKVMIKRFYKWLKGNDEKYPEEVSWINTNLKKSELRLPSEGDLLTEKEVSKLIDATTNSRDKAFVSVLYESGCRIGEIGNLKIKNVKVDEYGAVLNVFGKTGARQIRIINSTSYLITWINNHPFKDERDTPLWVGFNGSNEVLSYQMFCKILRDIFKKAKINKRCNPHSFRHARATFLANHLTEFQMNQYFGWVQGSDMPSTYVHLSGREVDNTLLALSGIKSEKEKEKPKLQPKKCPKCDTINSHNARYCCKCAGILDLQVAMELQEQKEKRNVADELMNKLIQDPEVQNLLLQKVSILEKSFIKN